MPQNIKLDGKQCCQQRQLAELHNQILLLILSLAREDEKEKNILRLKRVPQNSGCRMDALACCQVLYYGVIGKHAFPHVRRKRKTKVAGPPLASVTWEGTVHNVCI